MQLSDYASIATIVSAVVVVMTVVVALRALKWAKESAVAGLEAVKEGREAGEISKQVAELQGKNLETAREILKAAEGSLEVTKSLLYQQVVMLDLGRYEYLLGCVTEIEAAGRNQNQMTFGMARNRFQDALDLMPTGELTRCRELTQAHLNNAGNFTTNAKNELSEKIRWYRDQLMQMIFATIEPGQIATPIDL